MSLHVSLLGELLLTVRTLERFQPIVAEFVSLEAVQREEALRALGAQVRTLPRVRAVVHVEVALAGEALPAVGAGVRHLPRVGPSVQQQLPGGQERLSACCAQKILLPPVHLHVPCDAAFAKALPADRAQVGGAFVQPFVLLERVVAQEALVALTAGEYPASLVEPLVLIIARRAGESFLTLVATVGESVEPHVSLELIQVFKNLLTHGAFGFLLRDVLGHGPRAQKPFVFPRGLFPSAVFLIFHVVLHLLAFPLSFDSSVFLFLCPLFVLSLLPRDFPPFGVLLFLQRLPSGFFRRHLFRDAGRYSVLTLDVLSYLSLCAVSERALGAGE